MKTTNDAITAYPLVWPVGWPRAKERKTARFSKKSQHEHYNYQVNKALSTSDGYERLDNELWRLLTEEEYHACVVSTNIELKRDGTPYSNRCEPDDPGVAVYFTMGSVPHCLPCDRWDRVADNLAAVAAHINALRGIERWGVGDLKTAFAGFKALPEQGSGSPWYEVLGVAPDAGVGAIRKAYRHRAKEEHPDRNPNDPDAARRFQAVQDALHQALAARENGQTAR